MDTKVKQEFETSDLYLAAGLKTQGFRLLNLRKNGNDKGIFIFQDRPDRPQIVRDYYSGELTGSLKLFSNHWANLKRAVVEME